MATARSIPQFVAEDATSLIVFDGPPNRAVEWALIGDGALSEQSTHTGSNGKASAKFTPGFTNGSSTVVVSYGA